MWRGLGLTAWVSVLCAPALGGVAGLVLFPVDVYSACRWFGGGLVGAPVAAFVAGLAFGLPPRWRDGVIGGSLGALGVIGAFAWGCSVVIIGSRFHEVDDSTAVVTVGPWGSLAAASMPLLVVLATLAASVVFAVRAVRPQFDAL